MNKHVRVLIIIICKLKFSNNAIVINKKITITFMQSQRHQMYMYMQKQRVKVLSHYAWDTQCTCRLYLSFQGLPSLFIHACSRIANNNHFKVYNKCSIIIRCSFLQGHDNRYMYFYTLSDECLMLSVLVVKGTKECNTTFNPIELWFTGRYLNSNNIVS